MTAPSARDRLAHSAAASGRRTGVLVAKAAITACMVGLVLAFADVASVADHLRRAHLPLLGLALLLMLANTWLEAVQFAEIVRALGGTVTNRASFEITLGGRFFGTISPGSFGTDLYRALGMRLLGVRTGEAVRLAVASRLMSLLALVPVIAAGLPFAFAYVDSPGQRAALVAAPLLLLSMLAALAAGGRLAARFAGWWAGGLRAVAGALIAAAAGSPRSPSIWVAASGQHLVRVAVFAVIVRALGVDVPLDALFALVPLALLVAMVPVTLGSWGLRELSLVYALAFAGVEADAALAVSIAFGGTGLVFGALCGALWALAPDRRYG
jgi:uncharacterized membrane protein YbhN (UPF0104 family)